jgi:hypothetical protein
MDALSILMRSPDHTERCPEIDCSQRPSIAMMEDGVSIFDETSSESTNPTIDLNILISDALSFIHERLAHGFYT